MRWVASNTDPDTNRGFLDWTEDTALGGGTTLLRRFQDEQAAGPGTVTVEFDAPASAASLRLSVSGTGGVLAEHTVPVLPGEPATATLTFDVPADGAFTVLVAPPADLYLTEIAVDSGAVNRFGVTVSHVHALVSHVQLSNASGAPADTVFGGGLQRSIRPADVRRWIEDVSAVVDVKLSRRSVLTDPAQSESMSKAAAAVVATGAAAYVVDAAFPANSSVNDSGSYGSVLWNRYRTDLQELADKLGELTAGISTTATTGGTGGGSFPAPAFPDAIRW